MLDCFVQVLNGMNSEGSFLHFAFHFVSPDSQEFRYRSYRLCGKAGFEVMPKKNTSGTKALDIFRLLPARQMSSPDTRHDSCAADSYIAISRINEMYFFVNREVDIPRALQRRV